MMMSNQKVINHTVMKLLKVGITTEHNGTAMLVKKEINLKIIK